MYFLFYLHIYHFSGLSAASGVIFFDFYGWGKSAEFLMDKTIKTTVPDNDSHILTRHGGHKEDKELSEPVNMNKTFSGFGPPPSLPRQLPLEHFC